jgi:hypothetical protein
MPPEAEAGGPLEPRNSRPLWQYTKTPSRNSPWLIVSYYTHFIPAYVKPRDANYNVCFPVRQGFSPTPNSSSE